MMAVLLIAGIGFLLAGLLGIVFGIPVKEFSFGNTLILSGTVAACTGMIVIGLWMVLRELKNMARRLGQDVSTAARGGAARQAGLSAVLGKQARGEGGMFSRDQAAAENMDDAKAAPSPPPMPWRGEEAPSRDRARNDAPDASEAVEPKPAAKQRRNLMFSSSRKERERARARDADPMASDFPAAPAAPPSRESEAPPATFDDAWPRSERSRAVDPPLSRRSGRVPSTFAETTASGSGADRNLPIPQEEDQAPPVTVLKSGVVDGMAYSLYSDGSIEAQMPEGMMRFASIDELRSHLDQRP